MALARDVPFSQYGVDDITVTAADNIGNCAVVSNNSLRVTEAVAVVATVATVAVAFFVLVVLVIVVHAELEARGGRSSGNVQKKNSSGW